MLVQVVTENNKIIGEYQDIRNLIPPLLPHDGRNDFVILRFVDPYMVTTLNQLQIPVFLEEWRELKKKSQSDEVDEMFEAIATMAHDALREQHLYLKFVGD